MEQKPEDDAVKEILAGLHSRRPAEQPAGEAPLEQKVASADRIIEFGSKSESDAKAEIPEKDKERMLGLVENALNLYKESHHADVPTLGKVEDDNLKHLINIYYPLISELTPDDVKEINSRFRADIEDIKKEIEALAFEELGKNPELLEKQKDYQGRPYPNAKVYDFLHKEIEKRAWKYCDEYLQEKKGSAPKPETGFVLEQNQQEIVEKVADNLKREYLKLTEEYERFNQFTDDEKKQLVKINTMGAIRTIGNKIVEMFQIPENLKKLASDEIYGKIRKILFEE